MWVIIVVIFSNESWLIDHRDVMTKSWSMDSPVVSKRRVKAHRLAHNLVG